MTSVDSGVETGNESNDDPLDLKCDPRPEQMALVPLSEPSTLELDEATTSDVFPSAMRKVYLLHPLDGQGISNKQDGHHSLGVDIDSPNGITFPNLQATNFHPGLRTCGNTLEEPNRSRYPILPFCRPQKDVDRSYLKMKTLRNSLCFNPRRVRESRLPGNLSHGPIMERKLRLAVSTNNIETVQHLLFLGVNPNCFDTQRRAPLHLAACRGYADIVRLLLENGANPNQRDSLGNTPLHLAACTNNIVVVTLLLKAGTDVSSSDYSGRNPIQLAQSKLRLLRKHIGTDFYSHTKNQVYQVIEMMLEFLHKRGQETEAELLSAFSTRLTLSETKEQVETQVRDLLESLSGLSLDSTSNENSNCSTSSSWSSDVGKSPDQTQWSQIGL